LFGNIFMFLSTGGAPVVVKHRSWEPVNKVKIHPVHQLAQGNEDLQLAEYAT
jgi:hypothetical protein